MRLAHLAPETARGALRFVLEDFAYEVLDGSGFRGSLCVGGLGIGPVWCPPDRDRVPILFCPVPRDSRNGLSLFPFSCILSERVP